MSFSTGPGHVTVRMYNVGFGDSFLLAFPGVERAGRVLIDCGTHNASPRPRPIGDVVEHIVESVTDEDGVPRIDLVIGTHRHRDHVSGFEEARWGDVQVTEVWLPWTEDPSDPDAKRIRETQSKAAKRLHAALVQLLGADDDLVELAKNSLTNERAMRTLHDGFRGKPQRLFLPEPDQKPLSRSALGGVRIHVLGPSRDPEVIRDMEPPTGESYFRLDGTDEGDEGGPPFPRGFTIAPRGLKKRKLEHLSLRAWDMTRLAELSDVNHLSVAAQLEKSVNGTSLMLAFELGDALLLFPGDAQWGTWQRVINDSDTKALLARTTFYKVGHHGSHNATPKNFVEDVLKGRVKAGESPLDLRAMVSTHLMKKWKYIPKEELLTALRNLSERVVRSDQIEAAVPGFSYEEDLYIETQVPI